jgi:hypothetical protein
MVTLDAVTGPSGLLQRSLLTGSDVRFWKGIDCFRAEGKS